MAYSGKNSDLRLNQVKFWFNPCAFTYFSLKTVEVAKSSPLFAQSLQKGQVFQHWQTMKHPRAPQHKETHAYNTCT